MTKGVQRHWSRTAYSRFRLGAGEQRCREVAFKPRIFDEPAIYWAAAVQMGVAKASPGPSRLEAVGLPDYLSGLCDVLPYVRRKVPELAWPLFADVFSDGHLVDLVLSFERIVVR